VNGDKKALWNSYAQQAGSDLAKIQACLADKSPAYEAQINQNLSEGEDLIAKATNKPANVSGPFTPMVIVGRSLLLTNANTEAEYLTYFRNYLANKLK